MKKVRNLYFIANNNAEYKVIKSIIYKMVQIKFDSDGGNIIIYNQQQNHLVFLHGCKNDLGRTVLNMSQEDRNFRIVSQLELIKAIKNN